VNARDRVAIGCGSLSRWRGAPSRSAAAVATALQSRGTRSAHALARVGQRPAPGSLGRAL